MSTDSIVEDQLAESPYLPFKALQVSTNAHVTALAFGHAGHLLCGSADGCLRLYDLSTFKVLKAVRGLSDEIPSIVPIKRAGTELRDAWVACGRRVLHFRMDIDKTIMSADDAVASVEVCNEGDILNELSLAPNKSKIAFGTDSGSVGLIDLSSREVTILQSRHENICGTVQFVPERPNELVSGGYDQVLLHHDLSKNTIITRREIPQHIVMGGMSLSPPFIQSMAVSSTGVIASGLADGRLYVGFGGEKQLAKRGKKWNGLDPSAEWIDKVAEGPLAAMQFTDPDTLVTSTMLGVVMGFEIHRGKTVADTGVTRMWEFQASELDKVNTMVTENRKLVLGGFKKSGRGVVEILSHS